MAMNDRKTIKPAVEALKRAGLARAIAQCKAALETGSLKLAPVSHGSSHPVKS